MNKKGGDILASKTGFYIAYILLFTLAVGYSVKFIQQGEINKESLFRIEDNVIINRVISCLSSNNFGELDESKINEAELRKCLKSNVYNFFIRIETGKKLYDVNLGDVGVFNNREVKRFILLNKEEGILTVRYNKNVTN